jgi:hypothetical protein
MFEVDIAIVKATDCGDGAGVFLTLLPDELGHRPRLQGRPKLSQPGEVTEEHPHQLTLGFPEIREKLALFLRRQQVGGENRGRRHGRLLLGGGLALAASRLHCH